MVVIRMTTVKQPSSSSAPVTCLIERVSITITSWNIYFCKDTTSWHCTRNTQKIFRFEGTFWRRWISWWQRITSWSTFTARRLKIAFLASLGSKIAIKWLIGGSEKIWNASTSSIRRSGSKEQFSYVDHSSGMHPPITRRICCSGISFTAFSCVTFH